MKLHTIQKKRYEFKLCLSSKTKITFFLRKMSLKIPPEYLMKIRRLFFFSIIFIQYKAKDSLNVEEVRSASYVRERVRR